MGARSREHRLSVEETCSPVIVEAVCSCGGWKQDISLAYKGEDLEAKAVRAWQPHRDRMVRSAPRLVQSSEVEPERIRRGRQEIGYGV